MTNELSTDNTEHLYRGSLEPKAPTPEKKRLTLKHKIAVAALALMTATGVGYTANALRQDQPTKTETPANPGEEQLSLSAEAKKFVAEYGSRYDDPVSTYYAEKAYNPDINQGLILSDEYVANFDSEEQQATDGKSDMLGFKIYELPLNKKIDQAAFVEVFNDYIADGLSNYMNLLAKNLTPDSEAEAVIDSEFEKFYSDSWYQNMPAAFKSDDQEIANLMDTCKQVVAKYGSAANYSVAQASAYDHTDSQTGTIFNGTAVDSGHVKYDGREVEYYFTGLDVDIAIDIDLYKGNKATRVTETLKDTELTIWHQPDVQGLGAERFTNISIGQRK